MKHACSKKPLHCLGHSDKSCVCIKCRDTRPNGKLVTGILSTHLASQLPPSMPKRIAYWKDSAPRLRPSKTRDHRSTLSFQVDQSSGHTQTSGNSLLSEVPPERSSTPQESLDWLLAGLSDEATNQVTYAIIVDRPDDDPHRTRPNEPAQFSSLPMMNEQSAPVELEATTREEPREVDYNPAMTLRHGVINLREQVVDARTKLTGRLREVEEAIAMILVLPGSLEKTDKGFKDLSEAFHKLGLEVGAFNNAFQRYFNADASGQSNHY
ncbi:hypothetical protein GGS20DRAFT_311884 [Poronia punctata]|nr:hypothetical protein GGS20DRAFT_311884 [Poronia punctata]